MHYKTDLIKTMKIFCRGDRLDIIVHHQFQSNLSRIDMSNQPTFSTPVKSTPLSSDTDFDEGPTARESTPPKAIVPTEHLLAGNLNFPPGISPPKQLGICIYSV